MKKFKITHKKIKSIKVAITIVVLGILAATLYLISDAVKSMKDGITIYLVGILITIFILYFLFYILEMLTDIDRLKDDE